MRELEIITNVPGRRAAELFNLLCDFERYPAYSQAVRKVTVTSSTGNRAVSSWEVSFHRGILCWTEEDEFLPQTNTIRFQQLEGDIEHFSGTWTLHDTESGCVLRFAARLDLGIPMLSNLLEPIAEQALRDNIRSIVAGLLGDAEPDAPRPASGTAHGPLRAAMTTKRAAA